MLMIIEIFVAQDQATDGLTRASEAAPQTSKVQG